MFGRARPTASIHRPRFDPCWGRTRAGKFYRLPHLDPEKEDLAGVSGVFVIWHAGVRSRWVHVGHADDLAAALHAVVGNPEVMSYERNGGLYVAWARIHPDHREGVAAHLTGALRPSVATAEPLPDDVVPIPVLAPGQAQR